MKILENKSELSYLISFAKILDAHKEISVDHTQNGPSCFIRLSNYLSSIGECANENRTLNDVRDEMEINELTLKNYKDKYPNISDLQACLIYMFDDALSLNTDIANEANKEEITSFIKDIYFSIHKLEKYLPESTIDNIKEKLYKEIPDTMISFSEVRKNARLLAQAKRTNTGPFFFKDLPDELQVKIASLTANSAIHDESQSEEIAYKNLNKPSTI